MDLLWPLPHRLDLRDRLLAAYGEERRGYHDQRHLGEVLARIGDLGWDSDAEVVLAAWFHDAVYDGTPDDEERSARLALAELAAEDVEVDEVARLVRLTATHRPDPTDERGAVLCDADLAILAAPEERYADYVAGVRRDFAHVDDADFARGRAAMLRDLLSAPHLFGTDLARRHWEPAAWRNVEAELARLTS